MGFACLPEPASPERAARQAGIVIDDSSLLEWCRAQSGDPLLMEGVGGWAVPLTESLTVEELAMAMNLPVLVVSANRLGMINHTLLTVDAVRESGLTVAGIIINNAFGDPSDLKQWNVDDIRRWIGPSAPVTTIERMETESEYAQAGMKMIQELSL